jgi:hypothetical protein
MRRHMPGVVLGLTSLVLSVAAVSSLNGDERMGYILDHKTLYIAPDIGGAHRFELKGGINGDAGAGTLIVDKNTCKLNEFGDRTVCALAEYPPGKVDFSRLRLADPAMQNREVYSVGGPGVPKGFVMTLVIGRKSSPQVLRLVVSYDEKRSAFPLVPRDEYDKAP